MNQNMLDQVFEILVAAAFRILELFKEKQLTIDVVCQSVLQNPNADFNFETAR